MHLSLSLVYKYNNFNLCWQILDQICSLQPLNGNGRFTCFALFPRYFHNATIKSCEVFIYGGCGGNENRFDNKEECEQFCLGKVIKNQW